MDGLMMDYQLSVPAMLRRAEQVFGDVAIASRQPDRSLHRTTNAELAGRARRLGAALAGLGLVEGDRVATLMWNQHEHLEVYFGAPAAGFVTHTLNPRLHPDENAYIATHADDRVLVVDKTLWPAAEPFLGRAPFAHVVVVGPGETPPGALEYEALLAAADERAFVERDPDERHAAMMCFTSGTTGRPKGVLYSHRAIAIHALTLNACLHLTRDDVLLPVVPMFHVNAWCFPFVNALFGVEQVLPGPHLDPQSLLELFSSEQVTVAAGVPTIWMGILQALDASPDGWDLSRMRTMVIGGAAPPLAMIEAFQERHGLHVTHGWGMTELSPVGTVSGAPGQDQEPERRALQGQPIPFVEIRARGGEGLVPWDGEAMGELEVRGPSIASGYYEAPEAADRWTEDGWFRTGDIATIGPDAYVTIQDRAKDLVKSGGEWISSVALENALMGHPAVAEAAVIGIPDETWSERPLAVVVLREGAAAGPDELRAFLEPRVARFWLPDRFEFVDEIPKTAVGKFRKTALRERFAPTT